MCDHIKNCRECAYNDFFRREISHKFDIGESIWGRFLEEHPEHKICPDCEIEYEMCECGEDVCECNSKRCGGCDTVQCSDCIEGDSMMTCAFCKKIICNDCLRLCEEGCDGEYWHKDTCERHECPEYTYSFSEEFLEECKEIVKNRPSILRGWRKSPATLLSVVYMLYNRIARKRRRNDMFILLDELYKFVRKERETSSKDYMTKYFKVEHDESDIMKYPLDIQVLLLIRKAHNIKSTHGTFKKFASSVTDDQVRSGPN